MVVPLSSNLEAKLGYSFQNKHLLKAAQSHPSFAFREQPSTFERLEFLGDRVLSIVLAYKLYTLFPDKEEGFLSQALSSLVRKECIAHMMEEQGLVSFIKTSLEKNTLPPISILADAGEALLGAVFLDGGYEKAQSLILRLWNPYLNSSFLETLKDAKSRLQEKAQELGLSLPSYSLIEQKGAAHTPLFEVEVSLTTPTQSLSAKAQGHSKKEAEQKAAGTLLEKWSN